MGRRHSACGEFFQRVKRERSLWLLERLFSTWEEKESMVFWGDIQSEVWTDFSVCGFWEIWRSCFWKNSNRVGKRFKPCVFEKGFGVARKKKRLRCGEGKKAWSNYYFFWIVKVPLWIRTASLKGEFGNRLHSTDFVLFIGTLKLRLEIREIVLKVWWFLISRLCIFFFYSCYSMKVFIFGSLAVM